MCILSGLLNVRPFQEGARLDDIAPELVATVVRFSDVAGSRSNVQAHSTIKQVSKMREEIMSNSVKSGKCFCGSVEIEVMGQPAAMGYCHCASCREWSASPVNAFTLWQPASVQVTKGDKHLATYNKTAGSARKFCTNCGGHVLTDHPGLGLVDVFAAMLPDLDFEPGVHVNYGETVLRIKDGLPKLKDFPKEFGGSGDVVAE
jgi:hypothetical protein